MEDAINLALSLFNSQTADAGATDNPAVTAEASETAPDTRQQVSSDDADWDESPEIMHAIMQAGNEVPAHVCEAEPEDEIQVNVQEGSPTEELAMVEAGDADEVLVVIGEGNIDL